MVTEAQVHNGGAVTTRELVADREQGQRKFVTAIATGFYLRERKRGETFDVPAFNRDGSPFKGSWFVDATEGDLQRSNEAVEVDMAMAHASPRYQRPNSPEAVRAANAAAADARKADTPVDRDETVEAKAARLQAEERAKNDQAERDRIAAEEQANRNREDAKREANAGDPAKRQSPEDADRQASVTIEVGKLRDEASKLEAAGGKDNKRKAQDLREQANKLESGENLA